MVLCMNNYWNVFSAWGNTGHLAVLLATTWYRYWSLFLLPTAIILIFPIVHMLWYSRTLLVGIWVNRINPLYTCMHALHVGEFNSVYPNTLLWNSHGDLGLHCGWHRSSFGPAFTLKLAVINWYSYNYNIDACHRNFHHKFDYNY